MPTLTQKSSVTEIAPAASPEALAHFSSAFRFETDCWDVHASMTQGSADFVLLDVRSPEAYAQGHAKGAISLPHRTITPETMDARWPKETIFVVYCAGPHCNGAHRAAVRLAGLNRPVKIMIGGVTGWLDEGFALVSGTE
jgi:rhodanese-related sulfurtransferase